MPRHRTTARGVLFLLFIAFGLAAGASAATTKVPQLIFPVVGMATYTDDFGDARGQGSHEGNDIMSTRKAPAVAVEAGKVKFWTTSSRAGCMLYLYGASGTTYLYVHLNNDLTGKNDNRGSCVPGVAYARGLKDGAKVQAGQLIGYVGDSGDADGIQPHLHFELRPNGGSAVSPYKYLRKATKLLFYAKRGTAVSLALKAKVVSNLGGFINLKVSTLQVNSSKQVVDVDRNVVLSLASNVKVELSSDLPGIANFAKLAAVKSGVAVTVHTATAPSTLAAQRGDENALVAERIVLGG